LPNNFQLCLCLGYIYIQGGPEKILLETIDSIFVNSNFCEPPCIYTEAADGGVLQTNCSAPARKLKIDNFPGAK